MNILLIDDDEAILKAIGRSLTARGYALRTASSGREGLRLMAEDPPDLVISDIQMPGMDGVALLRAVRERFPDMPVILTTGYATVDTAIDALRLGACDYLKKPIRFEALLACIQRVAEGSRPGTSSLETASNEGGQSHELDDAHNEGSYV